MLHSRFIALAACLTLPLPSAAEQTSGAARTAFNPRISLILQGTYADFSSTLEPEVGGVLLGPETELRPAGLSLAETELIVEVNVDDQFHGWATVALENEDGETVVAVEEAYVNTLALPGGFAVKAGRFFSELGYLNHVHSHAWDFVDLPLVYRALLANQLNDDGVQVRWVAPTDVFFELGAELLRGAEFPGGGADRSGARSFVAFAHLGGDVGASHAWRLGVSHLKADANDRRTGEDVATSFSGDSDVRILDLVYKWAPDGNTARTNVVCTAEFFHREEDGIVTFNPDSDPAFPPANARRAYEGDQQGFYVQTAWQFVPRWRVGVRYDRLTSDNSLSAAAPAGTSLETLADATYDPQRWTAMLDFSNSEFSRMRLQYARDESRPQNEEDDQVFLQYIMSLGSHPAHFF